VDGRERFENVDILPEEMVTAVQSFVDSLDVPEALNDAVYLVIRLQGGQVSSLLVACSEVKGHAGLRAQFLKDMLAQGLRQSKPGQKAEG